MKILALFLVGIIFPISLFCQEDAKVTMDFQGVDMTVFLQWFSDMTRKKIVYADLKHAQKKVYFIAPEPVPEKSVETICMSLLESNGYTLVKVGKGKSELYKLVESSQMSSKPIAIYSVEQLKELETGDYYVSQLVMVKYLKASNIIASIRQAKLLDEKVGSLVEIKGANALILSDFLPNVRRIAKIIEMLDKAPAKAETAFVTLEYARADDISQKLQQIYQGRARDMADYNVQGPPTIIADIRTNSLTLQGNSQDIAEMKKLIQQWDKEIKGSEVVARIYFLQHITPEKILPTLREFIATPLFREKTLPSVQTSSPALVSVIPNEHTKSLLITAPQSAHMLIESIIQKLDVRRPQVLLEAVICEFTPSDVLNFGVELMRLDDIEEDNGVFGHGITSFGLSSIVDKAGNPVDAKKPVTPTGRAVGPGSGLVGFITKDKATNIPILLRALQSVTHTEVIAIPRILTDDGERAEIRVEQEEPVTSINALNTSTTTTSFKEFVAAGTVLIIKPQIIHKDWLRLEIEQNIEAFVGSPPSPGVPPPKSSRSLKTVVTVPNGHTVILGGLCGRREIETIDKIPLLGDIPILGLLFQSRSSSVTKTNLYVFINPRILYHPEFQDLKDLSQEEQQKIEKIRKKFAQEQEEEKEAEKTQ